MSKTLIQTTTDFIAIIQPKIGSRNLDELELGAKNILAEYAEISDLQQQISDLIGQQLDLADKFKADRVIHWQKKEESEWIDLHETYHQKREDYFRKVDNFLNHYYSFSNFLSEIIYQSLTHELKKGVRSGTFHQMFNSIATLRNHPMFPLVPKANQVIRANDYRSKELNHRKLASKHVMTVSHKSPNGKSLIELEPIVLPNKFEDEVDTPDNAPDDIVIQTLSDKSEKVINKNYIVHMMVGSSKLKPGDSVHYLPLIPFDYYKHLEKFGNHWHIFTRPGNKALVDLFYSSGEVTISTPDLWDSIVLMQKFVKQAVNILKK